MKSSSAFSSCLAAPRLPFATSCPISQRGPRLATLLMLKGKFSHADSAGSVVDLEISLATLLMMGKGREQLSLLSYHYYFNISRADWIGVVRYLIRYFRVPYLLSGTSGCSRNFRYISGYFGYNIFLELQSHIPEIISQVWVQLIFQVA